MENLALANTSVLLFKLPEAGREGICRTMVAIVRGVLEEEDELRHAHHPREGCYTHVVFVYCQGHRRKR